MPILDTTFEHGSRPAAAEQPMAEDLSLWCRVGTLHFAMRAADVLETMRPLPIQPLGAPPPYVVGLSVIRGVPVPVVDLGALLGARDGAPPGRFVVIRAGARVVALAVAEVFGVRTLQKVELAALPPLLRDGAPDSFEGLAALDGELLVVLRAARLFSESSWNALRSGKGGG